MKSSFDNFAQFKREPLFKVRLRFTLIDLKQSIKTMLIKNLVILFAKISGLKVVFVEGFSNPILVSDYYYECIKDERLNLHYFQQQNKYIISIKDYGKNYILIKFGDKSTTKKNKKNRR